VGCSFFEQRVCGTCLADQCHSLTRLSIDRSKFSIDLSELLLALCGFSIVRSEKNLVFHESIDLGLLASEFR
jgi:hypothetical protein